MRILCLYLILQMSLAPTLFAQQANNYSNNRLVMKIKGTSFQNEKSNNYNLEEKITFLKTQVLNKYSVDFNFLGNYNHSRNVILKFSESIDLISVADKLVKTGLLEYVELDYIGTSSGVSSESILEPNDFYFNRQLGLKNDGSLNLFQAIFDSDVDMDEAWELEQGSEFIVVAILDSGVRTSHPEFSGRIWQNVNESNSFGDDDNNGYCR